MMTPEGRALLDALRQEAGLDSSLPWGGRSPRVLTRGHKSFILESRDDDATALSEEELTDEQYRRFLGVHPGGC